MCGRTACTLDPVSLQKACSFKDRHGNGRQPTWHSPVSGQKYYPSYNVSPGQCTPILISASHCKDVPTETERVLQPMLWGLVPGWHKGDAKSFGYKMNNCRSETLTVKQSFARPLKSGRRCVVLADGFYEWKTDAGGRKHPYYIYPEQSSKDVSSVKLEDSNLESTTECCDGGRLLAMAGLFDVCENKKIEEPVYSYTVITVDSSPAMAHIHHRMPAILESPDEISDWLDYGRVPVKEALQLIRPSEDVCSHPVSSLVNNSRHNSPENIVEVDIKPKETQGSSFMKAWLTKGKNEQLEKPVEITSETQIKKEPYSSGVAHDTLHSADNAERMSKSNTKRVKGPMDLWVKKSPMKRKADLSETSDKKARI